MQNKHGIKDFLYTYWKGNEQMQLTIKSPKVLEILMDQQSIFMS